MDIGHNEKAPCVDRVTRTRPGTGAAELKSPWNKGPGASSQSYGGR